MKASYLALGLLACGLTPLLTHAEEKPAPFGIDYTSAGLETITVKDGKLHYIWHKERIDAVIERQSFESYDRFEIEVWLTKEELASFRDWIDRNKVFDFPAKYESREKTPTYGSAFQDGLTVIQGDKKHGMAWDGDSKTPESLGIAVSELRKLAVEVQKARNK